MADESHQPVELQHVYVLFNHIHTTDCGNHQAYRLAQLGSPKSSANRNFLGPNLPAKRGDERERAPNKHAERRLLGGQRLQNLQQNVAIVELGLLSL